MPVKFAIRHSVHPASSVWPAKMLMEDVNPVRPAWTVRCVWLAKCATLRNRLGVRSVILVKSAILVSINIPAFSVWPVSIV